MDVSGHDEVAYDDKLEVESCNYLLVQPSWINSEFWGLFAGRQFARDETICRYEGEIHQTATALRLADKSYLMRLGEQCYVDTINNLSCKARYINDCRNPAGYNVRFEKRPSEKCAYVVALRDINLGEELFVDYGKWYWAGCMIIPKRLSFGELNTLRGIIC